MLPSAWRLIAGLKDNTQSDSNSILHKLKHTQEHIIFKCSNKATSINVKVAMPQLVIAVLDYLQATLSIYGIFIVSTATAAAGSTWKR